MGVLDTGSLSQTLDNLNEIFFYEDSLSETEKSKVAQWIASRQGKPGSYSKMFAPTDKDSKKGIELFTGEKVNSRAAIGHILGEEACRALILLDSKDEIVKNALKKATLGMMKRIDKSKRAPGMYCCGICSVSLWRHLAVGGLEKPKERLTKGMEALNLHRDDKGRWRSFPFYYTLLALSEINSPSAKSEMKYTAPVLTQITKRTTSNGRISERRRILVERILESI